MRYKVAHIILIVAGSSLGTAVSVLGGLAKAEPVVVTGAPAPSARVSFADLDLGSEQGVARLKRRIRSAADELCSSTNREDVAVRAARARCYHQARDGGYAQVDRILAARSSGAPIAAAGLTVTAR